VRHRSRGCEESPGGDTRRPHGQRSARLRDPYTAFDLWGTGRGDHGTAPRRCDLRKKTVRIRRSKTGSTTYLPLLPEAGEAVLQYLQKSRPKTDYREMFLRSKAPCRPFKGGGALHALVHVRLKAAGVSTTGKHGPHIIRHGRAVNLLRAAVPIEADRRSPGPSFGRLNAGLSETGDRGLACRGDGDPDWSESMTTVSASPGPRQYVQQLRLRSPFSCRDHRCLLNGFHRFVAEQATDRSISQATVRQWLVDRNQAWPLNMLTDRARVLDHYLGWMVGQNVLAKNPLAELRKEYGQWATRPVVRAPLRPDFEAALEALRPIPHFGSILGPVMRDHVLLMQLWAIATTTRKSACEIVRLNVHDFEDYYRFTTKACLRS